MSEHIILAKFPAYNAGLGPCDTKTDGFFLANLTALPAATILAIESFFGINVGSFMAKLE